ncbi:MAG TPA: flagellar basal body rod protein FlgC [Stellaceae bacterium]
MSLFSVFSISGSGMLAESQRLAAVASNLANANSVGDAQGQPYRAREVVFQAVAPEDGDGDGAASIGMAGVRVAGVVTSSEPARSAYDPGSKFANADGYVQMPNVNPVDEMVNMISAQQNYQADLEAFNVAKTLLQKTLAI